MKIRLRWQDPVDRRNQDITHPLPVAIGRDPDVLPAEYDGQPVTPIRLRVDDDRVSRYHALVAYEIPTPGTGQVIFEDRSTHGTYINDAFVHRSRHPLYTGDRLRIGTHILTCDLIRSDLVGEGSVPPHHTIVADAAAASPTETDIIDIRDRSNLCIGRDPTNDYAIDRPTVSLFHAHIQKRDEIWVIRDLKSTNGTYLNGKRIGDRARLHPGDTIQIGPVSLTFNPESLRPRDDTGNLRLDAVHLRKTVGGGKTLLDDISLSIQAKEFVVIAGVSGGGKSTLLDALNGFRPSTDGSVLVNGISLYDNFNAYRTEIGYVPQKDIIHPTLTVEQTLHYAALLRMPDDTRPVERKERIRDVLDSLSLTKHRQTLVAHLSGGQLKRISMGVELLTQPSLFFLDEATSGLDPGTELAVMQLLRELADRGRTILLITHATENVALCDLVVFLAAGGRVAYFGPPKEAPAYFGVKSFNAIYPRVERERSPEDWKAAYRHSPQHERYVAKRQARLNSSKLSSKTHRVPKTGAETRRQSFWQQFATLTFRNLAILRQDRASLILTLAIAPILGFMDLIIWSGSMFDGNDGDPQQVVMMLFVTTIIAIMVGSLSSMREIVKENDIFRRERMVFLQLGPYLLSKVAAGLLISSYQTAIFVAFKNLAIAIPGGLPTFINIYLTLFLATAGGMMTGLLVSALAPNPNVAPLLIILTIIPQIVLGGGMIPIPILSSPGQFLSHFTFSRWAFESLVTITDFGKDIASDRCFADDAASDRNALTESDKEQQCTCLGPNLFSACQFPGIAAKSNAAVTAPAPQEPQAPGPFPSDRRQLNAYREEVENYQAEIARWREEYSDWKEARGRAIGEAEGIINAYFNDYGSTFNVKVLWHWSLLGALSASIFGLIWFVQERKGKLSR